MCERQVNNAEYFSQKGLDELLRKDFEHSILDYTKAIELEHENPVLYLTRGMAFRKMGKIHEALEDFRQAENLGLHIPKDFIATSLMEVGESAAREIAKEWAKANGWDCMGLGDS